MEGIHQAVEVGSPVEVGRPLLVVVGRHPLVEVGMHLLGVGSCHLGVGSCHLGVDNQAAVDSRVGVQILAEEGSLPIAVCVGFD